ncbi:MAG: hypothetical protein ABL309_06925 [Phycisphaerales bacterium]
MKRSRSVCRYLPVALTLIALASPATIAAPMFLDSVGQPGDGYAFSGADALEARFRADTRNWDLRLENNSDPAAGGTHTNLHNGRRAFQNREFDFVLSYSAALDRLQWTVTRSRGKSRTIDFDTFGLDSFNTIQFESSGVRASVDVANLVFSGFGADHSAWPSLSTSPDSGTFAQTSLYFGDDADLLAGDWELSGRVGFGDFTHRNPSDDARIGARLVQVSQIPGPASIAGLMIATGLCIVRRRHL